MDLYVIHRRDGWRTQEDLRQAADRSTLGSKKDGSGVRGIRSDVVAEGKGELTEIAPVVDTVFVRPDPPPEAA